MEDIARCALDAFDQHLNATFFSTVHTEFEERWDYIKSWDLGWINTTELAQQQEEVVEEIEEIIEEELESPTDPDDPIH